MSKYVEPVAMSEEEIEAWYPRTVSRWKAIRACADDCGVRWYTLHARKRYMCPAVESDCPVPFPHRRDEYGDPLDDECCCWQVAAGWHQECPASDDGAIPVWRVDERPQRIRRRLRLISLSTMYRRQRRRNIARAKAPAPVIWGGRVERRATWLDRFLGFGAIYLTVVGDEWIKLGESELRWCQSCRATTPHSISKYSGGWCEATRHGESKAAPMATDLRSAS